MYTTNWEEFFCLEESLTSSFRNGDLGIWKGIYMCFVLEVQCLGSSVAVFGRFLLRDEENGNQIMVRTVCSVMADTAVH